MQTPHVKFQNTRKCNTAHPKRSSCLNKAGLLHKPMLTNKVFMISTIGHYNETKRQAFTIKLYARSELCTRMFSCVFS